MRDATRKAVSGWVVASAWALGGCGGDGPATVPVPDAPDVPDVADVSDVTDDGAMADSADDALPGDSLAADMLISDDTDVAPEVSDAASLETTPDDVATQDATDDAADSDDVVHDVGPDVIAGPCISTFPATVRDFRKAHPDFEANLGAETGIVASRLGSDGKPVYAGSPTTPTTSGAENFNQWYRDVDGVNIAFEVPLTLTTETDGVRRYRNAAFFPIDGLGWGDEGYQHNYHFTLELRARFEYRGGEYITLLGDDDIWLFINGELVIDLGGVHGPMTGNVSLDEQAGRLGLEVGEVYTVDLFTAERHTVQSNLNITTNVTCFLEP